MPISFTCPHCGKETVVDDQFAGQSGPCAGCGETVAIPGEATPGAAPAGQVSPPSGAGKSVLVIVLIACLGGVLLCGGIMVCGFMGGLFLPAVQSAREAARRASCANNLKQIGLAMHNYADVHGTFPPAYLTDENGKPMHSWRVLILPELDRQDLYDRYNFDEPWNSPANWALANEMPDVFNCLSVEVPGHQETSYVMIVGPNTISDGPTARKLSAITDGTSNTIMIVEASNRNFDWLEPIDLKADEISYQINDGSGTGIGSAHPKGVNMLFCDGSVLFMSNMVPPEDVKAMSTINGGEEVYPWEY